MRCRAKRGRCLDGLPPTRQPADRECACTGLTGTGFNRLDSGSRWLAFKRRRLAPARSCAFLSRRYCNSRTHARGPYGWILEPNIPVCPAIVIDDVTHPGVHLHQFTARSSLRPPHTGLPLLSSVVPSLYISPSVATHDCNALRPRSLSYICSRLLRAIDREFRIEGFHRPSSKPSAN
jgi:hypothetical protein